MLRRKQEEEDLRRKKQEAQNALNAIIQKTSSLTGDDFWKKTMKKWDAHLKTLLNDQDTLIDDYDNFLDTMRTLDSLTEKVVQFNDQMQKINTAIATLPKGQRASFEARKKDLEYQLASAQRQHSTQRAINTLDDKILPALDGLKNDVDQAAKMEAKLKMKRSGVGRIGAFRTKAQDSMEVLNNVKAALSEEENSDTISQINALDSRLKNLKQRSDATEDEYKDFLRSADELQQSIQDELGVF